MLDCWGVGRFTSVAVLTAFLRLLFFLPLLAHRRIRFMIQFRHLLAEGLMFSCGTQSVGVRMNVFTSKSNVNLIFR